MKLGSADSGPSTSAKNSRSESASDHNQSTTDRSSLAVLSDCHS